MSQQRYVAPAVALCAALGVHVFILFYSYPSTVSIADEKTIEVTLLTQISRQQEKSKVIPTIKKEPTQKVLATQHKSSHQRNNADEQQDIPRKQVKADKPQAKELHKSSTNPALIPKDIQRVILTKITYPKQALRRGWEGQAKFSLEIHQHNIQHITMLVSTGYQILDRAAQRGIASIQTLPLHDGKHLLPITFRLQ